MCCCTGRVGRADRLGLALSFVSTVKEKVWYHKCKDRGRGCTNTQLLDRGGCTIWYKPPLLFEAFVSVLSPKEDCVEVLWWLSSGTMNHKCWKPLRSGLGRRLTPCVPLRPLMASTRSCCPPGLQDYPLVKTVLHRRLLANTLRQSLQASR
jgi:hypothetical protein